MLKKMTLNINGADKMIVCDPEDSLADCLRLLGLTGTKVGCDKGQCGVCSVLLDGNVVRACTRKMKKVPEFSRVVTIEGIGTPANLHPLQLAWIVHGGVQCGFCTPGFIVSAKGLLDTNPSPTRQDVRAWFQKHRNACRCTGYKQLVDAVMAAAKVLRGEMTMEELSFKIPADGRIYQSNVPKPAAVAKVTGTCDYGADLNLKLPKDALHIAMVNARGLPRQHPLHRHVRGREDAWRRQGHDQQGHQGHELYQRPVLFAQQQERRLRPQYHQREEGLSIRRRARARHRRYRKERESGRRQGESGAGSAARVYERPRRGRRGRD